MENKENGGVVVSSSHGGCGCACACASHGDHEHTSALSAKMTQFLLGAGILLFGAGFFIPSPFWAQVLFLGATLVGGFSVFHTVLFQIIGRNFFTMEVLMTLAVVGAIIIKQIEEASAVVLLFGIGQVLEQFASQRARKGIEMLLKRAPRIAIVRDDNGTQEIPATEVRVGQILEVYPGAMVPTDGVILEGASAFDESVLTGEARPVHHKSGEMVIAGSIALDGFVQIKATKSFIDNTFSRIITLVEESSASKANTQRFIETFASKYTPGVMVFALVVMLAPLVGFSGGYAAWFYKGLAVLLIGCPCALVISIPSAITSAISRASRLGVLIKGGQTLEALSQVETVYFDKTGTITKGQLEVVEIHSLVADFSQNTVLELAGSVESVSTHPIALAIVKKASEEKVSLKSVLNATALAGKGVIGVVEGKLVEVLSPIESAERSALSDSITQIVNAAEAKGYTVVVLHRENCPIGLIAMSDNLRDDSQRAIEILDKELQIDSIMLTGDNAAAANYIAKRLDIEAMSRCLPEDKTKIVREAAAKQTVAMVGDGINDAPALASAQVGVAMGTGTDVAMESADVVLTRGSLSSFVSVIKLALATRKIIFQNIVFALGFKATFLVLTFLGFATLWMAIIADTGATLIVTANALRLLGFGKNSFEVSKG